ncbi:MAG: flagellar biosynthetic protein FliR, partial [Romboutsia sp.]|nr:flagellar biosynthetic protein FliR [Romboutsia sp.]
MDMLFYVSEHLFVILIMFARISGLFLNAPVFSAKFIPMKIRLMICLFFSIIISGNSSYSNDITLYMLFWYVVLEFIFGTLIGLVSSLFLKAVNMFGASVDFMMGFGAMSGVGADGPTDSVSSILIEYLSILVFFAIRGHIHLFYIISEKINLLNFIEYIQSFNFITFISKCFMYIISNGINLAIPFLLVFLL